MEVRRSLEDEDLGYYREVFCFQGDGDKHRYATHYRFQVGGACWPIEEDHRKSTAGLYHRTCAGGGTRLHLFNRYRRIGQCLDLAVNRTAKTMESAADVKNLIAQVRAGGKEQAHEIHQIAQALLQIDQVTKTQRTPKRIPQREAS